MLRELAVFCLSVSVAWSLEKATRQDHPEPPEPTTPVSSQESPARKSLDAHEPNVRARKPTNSAQPSARDRALDPHWIASILRARVDHVEQRIGPDFISINTGTPAEEEALRQKGRALLRRHLASKTDFHGRASYPSDDGVVDVEIYWSFNDCRQYMAESKRSIDEDVNCPPRLEMILRRGRDLHLSTGDFTFFDPALHEDGLWKTRFDLYKTWSTSGWGYAAIVSQPDPAVSRPGFFRVYHDEKGNRSDLPIEWRPVGEIESRRLANSFDRISKANHSAEKATGALEW